MKKFLLFFIFTAISWVVIPQTKEVPFTLDDRDRLIKMEIEMESLRTELSSRIDILYWGFGILIALMILLFGYIVWDRRSALNPVQLKNYELSEKYFKLESALKEHAKNDPKLAEILRSFGLF
ncbi:MAG: hypothetical protein K9G67_03775 [Bacteroidales bacterium]|nr:hypothetical protein [Bacteroidales bacterium]MCF8343935.1 hypothetical protein [Bacteroidales bacterium]MCF8349932.1 hypothetical protein [Bacteroidales bacterium]MCF8375449.1 hypothetical protein [Bacteroidales bacterium]MCF8401347.1 hypothetical protein [Bacteroidales bacterium]